MKSKSIKKMRTKLEKIYDKLRLNNEIKNKKKSKTKTSQFIFSRDEREKKQKKKKIAH
jgi:hypothetical protein